MLLFVLIMLLSRCLAPKNLKVCQKW